METTSEKYIIPIGATNLYDIDYTKALLLLKEVKRRCQSEKSSQRQINSTSPIIRLYKVPSMYIK